MSAGIKARTLSSAEDFLNQGCQNVPGCLILDVKMPGISGLELQEKLVASGSTMPIIFISAHEDTQAREQAMKAGATAFLQKPFEDKVLDSRPCEPTDHVGRHRAQDACEAAKESVAGPLAWFAQHQRHQEHVGRDRKHDALSEAYREQRHR